MIITPKWMQSFETNTQTLILNSYTNAVQGLHWDQVMTRRDSKAGREILAWLLETASLYNRGNGGNSRFDELAATYFEIVNEEIGAGLILTKNEINDNQMNRPGLPKGMAMLDYAGQWATQMGALSAYHPQNQLYKLIAAGESAKSYDGVPFFSASHPVNGVDGTHGVFSNLFVGSQYNLQYDLGTTEWGKAATVLNSARAQIAALKLPNGMPRRLKPKTLLVPPSKTSVAQLLTGSTFLQGSTNTSLGLGLAPIVADELSAYPDEWYIGCEVVGENSLGAFVYQDREPFALTSYSPLDQAALAIRKEFLWDYDGRNVASYGHPYYFFKFKAA